MKVIADLTLCQGHARCQECCPEVFSTDEQLGKVVLLLEDVPEPLQSKADLAIRNCPEGALRVADHEAQEMMP